MKRILIADIFCVGFSASALADGRVFPPDNCSSASPFMAFNAIDGSNTYCINGQNIFQNALPGCAPDQIVAYNGSSFYCAESALNPPTCAPGEFVTADGTSFQCAETEAPTVPTCGPGEVLTGSGGNLACTTPVGMGNMQVELISQFPARNGCCILKSLLPGKKFSDYSALIFVTQSCGGTAIIPTAAFQAGVPVAVGGWMEGCPYASISYLNDTTPKFTYGSDAPDWIYGIK